MTLTMLFDLDDTLLINPLDKFLPTYLSRLSHSLKGLSAELVIKHLLAATQQMMENPSPSLTLEDNFNQHFYPALNTSQQEMQTGIDHFYADIYPSLKPLTSPNPSAQHVVSTLLEQGNKVIVATNPLFPATAINQRVTWAGFSLDKNPFSLITNFSEFHFSKPHPAFIAEILAQLGWIEQTTVMIGNDIKDDLEPASILGLPVFWVNPGSSQLPAGFHPLSNTGDLANVIDWANQVNTTPIEINIKHPQALLAILKSTPAAWDTFKRKRQNPETWKTKPARDEWCVNEIVCHIRDVEVEVNLPRLHKISREESPFLPGMDTDPWAIKRQYHQQNGDEALRQFTRARIELLRNLENLSPEEWLKPARHAIFGPTTLVELVEFMVVHDQNHIRQAYPLLSN